MSFVNDERLKDFKEQEDIKFKKLKNYVDDKVPDVTNSESIAAEGIVALDGVQNNPNGYTDAKGVKHETLASKIDKHGKGLVASENGVHGLRYDVENEKLIATDSSGGEHEIQTGGGSGAIDIGDVSGATVTANMKNVTIKWSDPEDVILSGVTLAAWGGTLVVRKEGSAPSSKSDGVVVVNSKVRNQYASTGFIDSTDKEYGKTYYYRFFPYTIKNSYTSGSSVSVGLNRTKITTVPSQSGTITYSGGSKTPSWNNYDSTKMTIGGTTSGTNAGSYNATFTPKDDYCWSDGSTTAKTVTWSIGKANGNVTLSDTSVVLNSDNLSKTVTISNSTGTVTISNNNESVAKATLSGNTITITHINETSGSATITVSIAESSNYKSETKTISVSCEFLKIVTFANGTNEEIAKMLDAHYKGTIDIADYWSVGDRRKIHLNAMSATGVGESHHADDYYFVIIGIKHDDLATPINGNAKAAVTIQTERILFNDTTTESYSFSWNDSEECGYMNSTNTNAGGWNGCARRTWCNNVFINALPSSIQSMVKTVNKKTSAGNQSSSIVTSEDKAFLLSEIEIFGTTTYSFAGEGTQYEYFKVTANRNKKPAYSGYSSTLWWERSPYSSLADLFCGVYVNGYANYNFASSRTGLAAALCL